MQSKEDTQSDSAIEVVPPIRHTVPWRVTAVEALPGYRLCVRFVDGTKGDVYLESFLLDASVEGTVFQELRDPAQPRH